MGGGVGGQVWGRQREGCVRGWGGTCSLPLPILPVACPPTFCSPATQLFPPLTFWFGSGFSSPYLAWLGVAVASPELGLLLLAAPEENRVSAEGKEGAGQGARGAGFRGEQWWGQAAGMKEAEWGGGVQGQVSRGWEGGAEKCIMAGGLHGRGARGRYVAPCPPPLLSKPQQIGGPISDDLLKLITFIISIYRL